MRAVPRGDAVARPPAGQVRRPRRRSCLALSVDRAGPERVKQFLDEIGVEHLHVYRDPKAAATRALKVPGLPATLLIDRQGREVGRVLGIAHWDGDAAIAAVRRLLGGTPDVVRTGLVSAPP